MAAATLVTSNQLTTRAPGAPLTTRTTLKLTLTKVGTSDPGFKKGWFAGYGVLRAFLPFYGGEHAADYLVGTGEEKWLAEIIDTSGTLPAGVVRWVDPTVNNTLAVDLNPVTPTLGAASAPISYEARAGALKSARAALPVISRPTVLLRAISLSVTRDGARTTTDKVVLMYPQTSRVLAAIFVLRGGADSLQYFLPSSVDGLSWRFVVLDRSGTPLGAVRWTTINQDTQLAIDLASNDQGATALTTYPEGNTGTRSYVGGKDYGIDAYFSSVITLLRLDGAITNLVPGLWTSSGDTRYVDGPAGFGKALVCSGSNYLQATAFKLSDLNGMSWTLEMRVYATLQDGNNQRMFSAQASGYSSMLCLRLTGNRLQVIHNSNAVGSDSSFLSSDNAFAFDRWVSLALTYDASTKQLYLHQDGVLKGSQALYAALSTEAYPVVGAFINSTWGALGGDPAEFFAGRIDEVRITKGVARYGLANYTPASTPLPTGYQYIGTAQPAIGPAAKLPSQAPTTGQVLRKVTFQVTRNDEQTPDVKYIRMYADQSAGQLLALFKLWNGYEDTQYFSQAVDGTRFVQCIDPTEPRLGSLRWPTINGDITIRFALADEAGGGGGGDKATVDAVVRVDSLAAERDVVVIQRQADGVFNVAGYATTEVDGEAAIELKVLPGSQLYALAIDDFGKAWVANLQVAVGDVVRPTVFSGWLYRCQVAGTLPATEPTWWGITDEVNNLPREIGTAQLVAFRYYRPLAHGPFTAERV